FTSRESGGGNERSFAVVGSLRQRLPAGSRSCIAGLAKRAANGYFASDIRAPQGHVAEWLRNGLQNRVPRFNSGRGLQINQLVGSSAAAQKPALPPWIRSVRISRVKPRASFSSSRDASFSAPLFANQLLGRAAEIASAGTAPRRGICRHRRGGRKAGILAVHRLRV